MKIRRMDIDKIFTTSVDTHKFTKEIFSSLTILNNLENIVQNTMEEFNSDDIDDVLFDEIDQIEEAIEDFTTEECDIFDTARNGKSDPVKRRIHDYLTQVREVMNFLNDRVDAYVVITQQEHYELKERLDETIGHLAQFVYYQYDLQDTAEGRELNESLKDYIEGKYDVDLTSSEVNKDAYEKLINEVNFVVGLYNEYKPRMMVFDSIPELEDEFYEVAGMYIYDFDDLEDKLTKEDVIEILKLNDDVAIKERMESIQKRSLN